MDKSDLLYWQTILNHYGKLTPAIFQWFDSCIFHTTLQTERHKSGQVAWLFTLLVNEASHIDGTIHGMWATGYKSLYYRPQGSYMPLPTLTIIIQDGNSSGIPTRYK